jgi:uncharacterized protein (TIGR03118 family)
MKYFRLAIVIPFFLAAACDDSGSTVDAGDARLDLRVDRTDTASDMAPSDAPADTQADVPIDGTVAEVNPDAPADGAPDAGADGGDAGEVADAPKPQRLTRTILVIDQFPDGGADGGDGGADAPVIDAGADGPKSPIADPNLVNPWGLAFNTSGPIWVANAGTGVSTVYNSQGMILPVVVTIPTAAGEAAPSSPTGIAFNPGTAFMSDRFIFVSEGGLIAGWQTGATATTRVDNATSMASYKGLTIATRNNVPRLYATDFHNGKVDVYDTAYVKVTTTGGFADATIPAGYAPFGIMADGAEIYVTYAKQDATAKDDVAGAGFGYINVFDFDGVKIKRLVSQGALNAPWGLAIAPSDFGTLSHTLLVGNFGDGRINAYDPVTGTYMSTAADATGAPLVIDGLWALVFGNDTTGAAHNQLFFTAGPDDEEHGILGRLDFVP